MPGIRLRILNTRAYSLRAHLRHAETTIARPPSRAFSTSAAPSNCENLGGKEPCFSPETSLDEGHSSPPALAPGAEPEQGAMSRRLADATEDALLLGGKAGRQAVANAGFSEELKARLLEKVKAAEFRSDHAAAFTETSMGSNVGRGSRDVATGQAWTGSENTEDTVLRMLDDAKKPLKPHLRGPSQIPNPAVDLRLKSKPKIAPGQRLANARDKSSMYAISKDSPMSDKEREDLRREFKERFTPGARPMPNSIRGLAALANERIEDAIARGQFKNIPRGKGVERDVRADNPFVDTTEYIMNKMIQRQDIVPPWIEKQQELVRTARVFRARLRNDWKRHAARTIASRGGTMEECMALADRYAETERAYNPRRRPVEQISVPTNVVEDFAMVKAAPEAKLRETKTGPGLPDPTTPPAQNAPSYGQSSPTPLPPLFRIPEWEAAELSYLQLSVDNLNSLTRSYNLMAPDLAKKPYFSLERELNSCYADVAPQLAGAIRERATRPTKDRDAAAKNGHRTGSVLERLAGESAVVHDSKRPPYGFKELWNDLWRDGHAS